MTHLLALGLGILVGWLLRRPPAEPEYPTLGYTDDRRAPCQGLAD